MRVLLLTSPHHIYSNYLIKSLLKKQVGYEVIGIIESDVLLPGKGFIESLLKYLRTAGCYFFISQGIKLWFYRICCGLNHIMFSKCVDGIYYSYTKYARLLNIPIYSTKNINNSKSQSLIKSLKPDLIMILLFGQILKENVVNLPDMGVINFHPSYLPNYRGLMPIFWAMANNENETGVTLHFVDSGIDTGPIISRSIVHIKNGDSEHSVYARSCVVAKKMLLKVLDKLSKEESLQLKKSNKTAGKYYSIPTIEAVNKYRKSGRKFFRFSELVTEFDKL